MSFQHFVAMVGQGCFSDTYVHLSIEKGKLLLVTPPVPLEALQYSISELIVPPMVSMEAKGVNLQCDTMKLGKCLSIFFLQSNILLSKTELHTKQT